MLDDALKAQLQQYLGMLRQPIRLIASLDDSDTGKDMGELLSTIVGLSDKVSLDTSGNQTSAPEASVVFCEHCNEPVQARCADQTVVASSALSATAFAVSNYE